MKQKIQSHADVMFLLFSISMIVIYLVDKTK